MNADETRKTTPPAESAEATEATAAETTEAGATAVQEEATATSAKDEAGAAEAGATAAKRPPRRRPAAAKATGEPTSADAGGKVATGRRRSGKAAASAAEASAKAAPRQRGAKKEAGTTAAARPAAKRRATAAAPAEAPAERPPKPRKAERPAHEPRRGEPGVANVVDTSGKAVETRELNPALFKVPANVATLHLVVRAEQAARRRGTASTRTRGEVSGSTAKLYRQKGTGRARAGDIKSPLRTGGGTVFGPKPRDYSIKVNKKVRRKALAMALSDRAATGSVFVVRDLALGEPSTRTVARFLADLDVAAPVLVVTSDEPVVTKSVRNLPYADASEASALTVEQVLRARTLVLTEKAFVALNEA